MRIAWAAALSVILLAAGIAAYSRVRSDPARTAAIRLLEQSAAAEMAEHPHDQLTFLLRAIRTDPDYIPSYLELSRNTLGLYAWSQYGPEIEQTLHALNDPALAECARQLLWMHSGAARPLSNFKSLSRAASECRDLYQMQVQWKTATRNRYAERTTQYARKYPGNYAAVDLVLSLASESNDRAATLALAQKYNQRSPSPLVRARSAALIVQSYRNGGDDSAAARVTKKLNSQMRREPRQARYLYFYSTGQTDSISLQDAASIPDRYARIFGYIAVGYLAYENGRLGLSYQAWDRVARDFADVPDILVTALIFRGRTHLKSGELSLAEADLLAAKRVTQKIPSVLNAASLIEINHNLFHVYEAQNRPAQALAAGYDFIASTQIPAREDVRMMSYHDVGWYYWKFGDYHHAQPMLNRMLLLIDSMQRNRHYAGEYYERIGELDRAIQLYTLADSTDHIDSRSIARIALLTAQMGDSARAIRVAARHDASPDPNYPEFTPVMPAVLAALGMPQRALAVIGDASRTAFAQHRAAAFANLALQRARLELEVGAAPAAEKYADTAVVYAVRVNAFETELIARATRALARARATADPKSAGEISRLLADRRAARLPQLQLQLATLLGDTHATLRQTAPALLAYARAAGINDSLAASLGNDADRAGLRSAANDVSGRAISLIARNSTSDQARLYARWSIRRKTHALPKSQSAGPGSIDAGSAILDFVQTDSAIVAAVFTHDRSAVRILPINFVNLSSQIRELRNRLAPRIGAAIDTAHAAFDAELARTLFQELVAPFNTELTDVKTLVIVPDGVLYQLPFDLLLTEPQNGTPSYMVQRYEIHYAPSLAFARSDATLKNGPIVAIAGPSAPNAEAEIKAIALASTHRTVVTMHSAQATKQRIRTLAPTASILHFATHATPNDVQPLFAYLNVGGDSSDDGRLNAFEIERWQLPHSLVVLSGCDTGSGRIAGGEGVLSLSRVFLRAGAGATIATLWPVGGASAEFMGWFYEELARGAAPAKALRAAKLKALSSPFNNPLYWAPFVLISA